MLRALETLRKSMRLPEHDGSDVVRAVAMELPLKTGVGEALNDSDDDWDSDDESNDPGGSDARREKNGNDASEDANWAHEDAFEVREKGVIAVTRGEAGESVGAFASYSMKRGTENNKAVQEQGWKAAGKEVTGHDGGGTGTDEQGETENVSAPFSTATTAAATITAIVTSSAISTGSSSNNNISSSSNISSSGRRRIKEPAMKETNVNLAPSSATSLPAAPQMYSLTSAVRGGGGLEEASGAVGLGASSPLLSKSNVVVKEEEEEMGVHDAPVAERTGRGKEKGGVATQEHSDEGGQGDDGGDDDNYADDDSDDADDADDSDNSDATGGGGGADGDDDAAAAADLQSFINSMKCQHSKYSFWAKIALPAFAQSGFDVSSVGYTVPTDTVQAGKPMFNTKEEFITFCSKETKYKGMIKDLVAKHKQITMVEEAQKGRDRGGATGEEEEEEEGNVQRASPAMASSGSGASGKGGEQLSWGGQPPRWARPGVMPSIATCEFSLDPSQFTFECSLEVLRQMMTHHEKATAAAGGSPSTLTVNPSTSVSTTVPSTPAAASRKRRISKLSTATVGTGASSDGGNDDDDGDDDDVDGSGTDLQTFIESMRRNRSKGSFWQQVVMPALTALGWVGGYSGYTVPQESVQAAGTTKFRTKEELINFCYGNEQYQGVIKDLVARHKQWEIEGVREAGRGASVSLADEEEDDG